MSVSFSTSEGFVQPETASKARDLVTAGAELAGAALGGAIGFFAGGPGSAAALGATGAALTRSLTYAADLYMTQRERARVGSVAAIVLDRIRLRAVSGDVPREDLFNSTDGQPPQGEELLEGTLLKARDEYEQRKLPFVAAFYANLVFERDVAPAVAFMLLKTLEKLTYRQLVVLAILATRGTLDVSFIKIEGYRNSEVEALKREVMDLSSSDLGTMGLVDAARSYTEKLSSLGSILVSLADVSSVNISEQEQLLELMATSQENARVGV